MRASWLCGFTCVAASVCATHSAQAEQRALALGFNLDLLPTALSAANGKLGYAPQAWFAVDHVRVRFVLAHLEPPDAFAFAPKGFRDPTQTVFASVVDYTFGAHHDGAWLGAGSELWQRTIQHEGVPGEARWTSAVVTAGGGYIWCFAGDAFLDPWAAAHLVLNPERVALGPYSYRPSALAAEISLKIGWFTEL